LNHFPWRLFPFDSSQLNAAMKIGMFWCLIVLLASCTPKIQTSSIPDVHDEVVVKVDSAQVDPPFEGETVSVSGTVFYTASYCGGAAPSREMLDNAQKPHPLANYTLIARSGTTNRLGSNMVAKTTTDADGRFEFHLPRGTFCIVLGEKEAKRAPEFFNNPTWRSTKTAIRGGSTPAISQWK
jgi:hypothetical protein